MKLKVDLFAEGGVAKAREALGAYLTALPTKMDTFCRRLAEIGVDAAVTQIKQSVDGETGELANSIHVEQEGEREWLVVTYCDYAAYVEFGTGLAGMGIEYPGEYPEGIKGPSNEHDAAIQPEEGAWVYYDKRQGRYRITSGQQPVAFMAMASTEMYLSVMEIAKEVFNGD